jgi:predicted  nucleic acid-binding Zn ribbon protein
LEITKAIIDAGNIVGIGLLDHIIIGKEKYFSFSKNNIITASHEFLMPSYEQQYEWNRMRYSEKVQIPADNVSVIYTDDVSSDTTENEECNNGAESKI